MRAITLSRLIAVAGSIGVLVGCQDTLSPQPPLGVGGTSGFTVVPSIATIHTGQVVMLQVRLNDEFGAPLESAASWTSSNDAVATVAATGEVYGRSEGVVAVTASALGKAHSSTIRVLAREPKGGKPLLRSPAR
jgi:Big-like domain-containing protein